MLSEFSKLVDEMKAPIVNGVFTPANKFYAFRMLDKLNRCFEIEFEASVEINNPDDKGYSYLDQLGFQNLGKFSCIFGEGSFGSDGFAILLEENQPIWLFFSPEINPIVGVKRQDNLLVLENNLVESILIPTPL